MAPAAPFAGLMVSSVWLGEARETTSGVSGEEFWGEMMDILPVLVCCILDASYGKDKYHGRKIHLNSFGVWRTCLRLV